jgi:hypothetical protein
LDSPEYVREKLAIAVPLLVSARTVQDRLFSAYSETLYLLQPDDFPEPLRDDFRDLQEALTHGQWTAGAEEVIAADHGAIRANTSAMSDEEAEGWAKVIVELFTEITRPRAG